MTRFAIIALLISTTLPLSTTHAATPELRAKLASAAEAILAKTNKQAVILGKFTDNEDTPNANSGPGIANTLKDELIRLKPGSVQEDALFLVKGDYSLNELESKGLHVMKITLRVINRKNSEPLGNDSIVVTLSGTNTIASMVQVNASLPPEGTQKERNKKLIDQAKKPQNHPAHIHGDDLTLVSSNKRSPYAVEVLVKPLKNHEKLRAKSRMAALRNGQAFVGIDEDELYELKIYNNSAKPLAIRTEIDGLDVFHFSQDRKKDGTPRFNHFILHPHSDMVLVGWHNKVAREAKDNFLSFLVTEYGKGASARSGKATGKVGVIHLQFSHCSELKEGARAAPGTETGFGPPRQVTQKIVRYQVEPPHDFVSIRYNR